MPSMQIEMNMDPVFAGGVSRERREVMPPAPPPPPRTPVLSGERRTESPRRSALGAVPACLEIQKGRGAAGAIPEAFRRNVKCARSVSPDRPSHASVGPVLVPHARERRQDALASTKRLLVYDHNLGRPVESALMTHGQTHQTATLF